MGVVESAVEKYLTGKIEELMGHGATKLTGSLCRLVRMFKVQPVIGTEIIFFVMTRGLVPEEQDHVTAEARARTEHTNRLRAQELCIRILNEDKAAEAEYERLVATYLKQNEQLRGRLKRR